MNRFYTSIGAIMLGVSIASAQVSATGTFSDVPNGSNFNYTLSLHNTGANSIDVFWFAWIPDQNFMNAIATNIISPSGWSGASTSAFLGDGYGIEWQATTPLAAGGTATFGFTSSMSPTTMAGPSPVYPIYQTTTSYIYQGAPYPGTSPSNSLVLTPTPEPATLAVFAIGGGLLVRRRRKNRS